MKNGSQRVTSERCSNENTGVRKQNDKKEKISTMGISKRLQYVQIYGQNGK